MKVFWNDKGKELLARAEEAFKANNPLYLEGEAGMGKSVFARYLAFQHEVGYYQFNCFPGMDLDYIFGFMSIKAVNHGSTGITADFCPGLLVKSMIEGAHCLVEEITRSPQKMMSKMFSATDDEFAAYTVIETGEVIKPKQGFWIVATGNPVTQDYLTSNLDYALDDRFVRLIIDDVIVDEEAMLKDRGCTVEQIKKLLHVTQTLRKERRVHVSTRNLSKIGKQLVAGTPEKLAYSMVLLRGQNAEIAQAIKTVLTSYNLA